MTNQRTVWLIVAAALTVIGVIIFAVAMTGLGWNFLNLSSSRFETNTYEVTESFESIAINADTEDITFLPSTDGKCKIVCHEKIRQKHAVSVENSVLKITVVDETIWTDYIFNFGSDTVTIFLPESKYCALVADVSTGEIKIPGNFSFTSIDITTGTGDVECRASADGAVKIAVRTADIEIDGTTAASLDLKASTGDVEISNATAFGEVIISAGTGDVDIKSLRAGSLSASIGTGDAELSGVITDGKFTVVTRTADVRLNRCDAAEFFIETTTGDVTGSILTPKVFIAKSGTGDVDVPRTTSGGMCEIKTGTGDIRIRIAD